MIERERPDALLRTLGGQTALNLAKALHDDGTLERFGVELIGANYEAIACAEDRELFGAAMARRGPADARSAIATTLEQAMDALPELGPAVHRAPRLHARRARRRDRAQRGGVRARSSRAGIEASPIGQVLLDESVIGWGEFELEVMRDSADNVVIVCSIENVDPMGVHTGDSVTVAPAADAHRPPLPAAARPGDRGDPRGRAWRPAARTCSSRSTPRPRRSS